MYKFRKFGIFSFSRKTKNSEKEIKTLENVKKVITEIHSRKIIRFGRNLDCTENFNSKYY